MDLLLAIAAAAGLIWTGWFLLRGSLIGGCIAAVLACACLGYSTWHSEGGQVPLTIDRALIALVALGYIIHRRWGLADPKPLATSEWVLLAFLGWLALSAFTNDWAYKNSMPVSRLIFYWTLPAIVYWVARQSPISERGLRFSLGAIAGLGVYLTFTALAEYSHQWWAVFPTYIASPETEYFGRARGPFLNPAEMGIYLAAGLAAALTFWHRLPRLGQLVLVGFIVLNAAAIYATLTRSAWMGGALGLALFVGFSASKQWRYLLFGAGALAGVLLLVAAGDRVMNIKRDANLDAAAAADSAQLRPILARVAWLMFLDRPIAGCGFGQYDREKRPYLSDRSTEMVLEKVRPYVQHNAFLALLTETGLIGMGLFIALLVLWLRNAWLLWNDPAAMSAVRQITLFQIALFGAYLPNAMFQDTNLIEGVNLLMFFIAGLTSNLVAVHRREQQSPPDLQNGNRNEAALWMQRSANDAASPASAPAALAISNATN
jgi:O-antigen ligase